MITLRSRGIATMLAVLVTGSMLTRIIVSDRDGSSSRRSTPIRSIVSRPVPFHLGISPGVDVAVGVIVGVGVIDGVGVGVAVPATAGALVRLGLGVGVLVLGTAVAVGSTVGTAVSVVSAASSSVWVAITMIAVPSALRTATGTGL